jgi:hypothetical protein
LGVGVGARKGPLVRCHCGRGMSFAGEDAVKAAGVKYLPRLDDQSDDDYDAYRMRGSFFNATARTGEGFVPRVAFERHRRGVDAERGLDKRRLERNLTMTMTRLKMFCVCLAGSITALVALAGDSVSQPGAGKGVLPGSFQIRNQKYGNLLRPEEANRADGTRIVLYPAQPWKCMTWKLHGSGDSRFQLQNHFTGKTFAAEPGAGKAEGAVTQVPFSKKPEERPTWDLFKLTDGTYKITDTRSGKALTAVKEEAGSEAKIVVRAWREEADQKWELIEIDPTQLTM